MSEGALPLPAGDDREMDVSRFETLSGAVDRPFPEYEAPPSEPFALLTRWLEEAQKAGVREPRALALGTANVEGRSSSRIVAITALDSGGLIFLTHSTSRKAREMAETGWASGVLYWRETGQQVTMAGPVRELPPSESERLWFARPIALQPMSTVSYQSEPLLRPDALKAEAHRLAQLAVPLPRPNRFVGYRLEPQELEFWCASSDRLHRRLRYVRKGQWSAMRLQP